MWTGFVRCNYVILAAWALRPQHEENDFFLLHECVCAVSWYQYYSYADVVQVDQIQISVLVILHPQPPAKICLHYCVTVKHQHQIFNIQEAFLSSLNPHCDLFQSLLSSQMSSKEEHPCLPITNTYTHTHQGLDLPRKVLPSNRRKSIRDNPRHRR